MKKLFAALTLCLFILGMTACADREGGAEDTGENTVMDTSADDVQGSTDEEEAADGADGWSGEMQRIKDAVTEALGDDYLPDTPLSPEMLEGNFGISPDLYEDYLGETPMIGANVDTLLIIKAKDDKVDEVEDAVNTYRENLVNDTMQYPMNKGKIQASRIDRIGNYVCFVQLGVYTMDEMDDDIEAVILKCREQNELVLEIIRRNL